MQSVSIFCLWISRVAVPDASNFTGFPSPWTAYVKRTHRSTYCAIIESKEYITFYLEVIFLSDSLQGRIVYELSPTTPYLGASLVCRTD